MNVINMIAIYLFFFAVCIFSSCSSDEQSRQRAIKIVNDKCASYAWYRYKKDSPFLSSLPGRPSAPRKKILDCVAYQGIIVGGVEAKPKEFPHMALIGYSEPVDNDNWKCGGTLISERFVLSAAHCSNHPSLGPPKYVLLGDLDYTKKTDKSNPKLFRIIQIINHPGYNPPDVYNDIALFKLNATVQFNAFIRPLCLYTSSGIPSTKQNKAQVTGWGVTSPSEISSSSLQKTELIFLDKSRCENQFKTDTAHFSRGFDSRTAVCAGTPHGIHDTCQGDSGGPLQVPHTNRQYQDCMWLQVGITAFGTIDCEGKPSVYTRVSYYIEWIQGIVWPEEGTQ